MVEYLENMDLAVVNGYKFRRDKKTGYYLCAKLHKRLHVYMWELFNGKVEKGFHVHHIDHNKFNNEIDNLALLSQKEHVKRHAEEMSEELKEKLAKNVVEKAVPAAREWHKTEEGKQWHSKHAVELFKKREPIKYNCSYCGEEFITKKVYGLDQNCFCSNNCRSAFRRKSGVDNEIKQCIVCGGEFSANKYTKSSRCPSCRNKKHRA